MYRPGLPLDRKPFRQHNNTATSFQPLPITHLTPTHCCRRSARLPSPLSCSAPLLGAARDDPASSGLRSGTVGEQSAHNQQARSTVRLSATRNRAERELTGVLCLQRWRRSTPSRSKRSTTSSTSSSPASPMLLPGPRSSVELGVIRPNARSTPSSGSARVRRRGSGAGRRCDSRGWVRRLCKCQCVRCAQMIG